MFEIISREQMNPYFSFLEEMRGVEQNKSWHSEGDVLNHTLQVLEIALRETTDLDLILAAMLHDVGKIVDPLKHDSAGAALITPYTAEKTIWLVRHHMRGRKFLIGEMKRYQKRKYFEEHPFMPDLEMLIGWNERGRDTNKKMVYNPELIHKEINRVVNRHFPGM